MEPIENKIKEKDNEVDNIHLSIDYEIIEHFSQNLYSSPNKAVEELVANGYDAGAGNVRVYIPGRFSSDDNVIVWDDGESMDEDGLQQLWLIATSPKKQGDRMTTGPSGQKRLMIGKFGIGKLASYTLGNSISHLCKRNNRFLYAEINYNDVLSNVPTQKRLENINGSNKDTKENGNSEDTYDAPVYEIGESKAKFWIKSHFHENPTGFESQFEKDTWTYALVSNLKVDISPGRLKWVLGNGMPSRPDFQIYVDDDPVRSRFTRRNLVDEWKIGDERSKEKIISVWNDMKTENNIDGELLFGRKKDLDPDDPDSERPYVEFENLGRVWGEVTLHDRSLKETRAAESGRSHGFFVMVRDRLVNPKDPPFLIDPPSYGTFNRSKYVIHADGLDEDLLASREEVNQESPRVKEFRILCTALYRLTRSRWEELEEDDEGDEDITTWIPTNSVKYYRGPLNNLLEREDRNLDDFDLDRPEVELKSLGEEERISDFSDQGFSVNDSHPYLKRLREEHNFSNKKGKQILREFELISISEKWFEGFIRGMGLSDNTVNEILSWRDGLFRRLANITPRSHSKLQRKVEDASYRGGDEFEEAIVNLLSAVGFEVKKWGGNESRADGIIIIPMKGNPLRISIEAKGRSDDFEDPVVGRVDTHRKQADAQHAILVARDFQGFEEKDVPQLLEDCHTSGNVSLISVETLITLADAIETHHYSPSNPEVIKVFTEIENPSDKLVRVQRLQDPLDRFPYRDFLEDAWNRQNESGLTQGTPQPLRQFEKYLEFIRENEFSGEDEEIPGVSTLVDSLASKVQALSEITDAKNLIVDRSEKTVLLKANPSTIVDDVESHLREK